jgi:hypothetical protein
MDRGGSESVTDASRLDDRKQLAGRCGATIYRTAGEATAWERRNQSEDVVAPAARRARRAATVQALGSWGWLPLVPQWADALAEHRDRRARMARGRIRRYAAANRLTRLCTLTFRTPCLDRRRAMREAARCMKRLREKGFDGAYVLVPEWHPGVEVERDGQVVVESHGWHVHVAVNRFVVLDCERCVTPDRRKQLAQRGRRIGRSGSPCLCCAWGRGFVDARAFRARQGARGRGPGAREAARRCAGYVAKYVAKGLDGDGVEAVPWGAHAYEVGQGHGPERVVVAGFPSLECALGGAVELLGQPSYVWDSRTVESWTAPPAMWASWP